MTAQLIHVAETSDGTSWVSLNGENWLPVTCEPTADDYDLVVKMFEGKDRLVSMTRSRRWLCIGTGWDGQRFEKPQFKTVKCEDAIS